MNPEDLQQQLAPLRLPELISWWPPAIGWWILVTLLLVFVGLGVALWRRKRRHNQHRRQALTQLEQLIHAGENTRAALNRLLKTIVMYEFPAEQVAALNGSKWIEFLARHCPKTSVEALAPLIDSYRPNAVSIDIELTEITRQWIKHHEVADV